MTTANPSTAELRAWALDNGIQVADRGRISGDVLDWAREESVDRDVIIIGSGSLCDLFIDAGAVDEYRLRVFPTATGAGRRLFPNGCRLDLVSSERMGPTMLTIYTPGA